LGLTEAEAIIQGPKGNETLRLLVDTGSLHSWIDAEILQKLGIEPRYTMGFRTITGTRVERQVGFAEVEMLGVKFPCVIVFAQRGDAEVLGATTLENLGLEVDLTTREIRRSEALAAY